METLFPLSPPSSPSSPSLVATLRFGPDADRMTAPGRAEDRPCRTSPPVGYRVLIVTVRSLPTVSPSPARCLAATASPASARLPSTAASPATTRLPSLRTGSHDPVLPPAPLPAL